MFQYQVLVPVYVLLSSSLCFIEYVLLSFFYWVSVYVPVSSLSPNYVLLSMHYWVFLLSSSLCSSIKHENIQNFSIPYISGQSGEYERFFVFHIFGWIHIKESTLCGMSRKTFKMSLRHSSDFLYLCSFTLKLRQNCNVFGWYTCIKTAPSLVYTVHYWLYILYIIVMVRIILEWLWPF